MSQQETGVEGGAGNVLSGAFSGDIHIASGPTADKLAEQLMRDYGPPMANLKATMGLQQRLVELEKMLDAYFTRNEQERIARQRETDAYRAKTDAQLWRHGMIMALLAALIALTMVAEVAIVAWVVTR